MKKLSLLFFTLATLSCVARGVSSPKDDEASLRARKEKAAQISANGPVRHDLDPEDRIRQDY